MKHITVLAAFLLFTLTLFSCKEEVVCPVETEPVEGLIQYSGPVASDGCGWLLKIGTKTYSPTSLPPEYQKQEEQRVWVSYRLLEDKFHCGFKPYAIDKVQITGITPF